MIEIRGKTDTRRMINDLCKERFSKLELEVIDLRRTLRRLQEQVKILEGR